ncbi:hypothetical protein EJ110_NYTH30175 [Nymphaea thermarum]|nr:hypothetical protein EJ110_NYTH30175 [Nymphaea thermarum]
MDCEGHSSGLFRFFAEKTAGLVLHENHNRQNSITQKEENKSEKWASIGFFVGGGTSSTGRMEVSA